MLRPRSWALLSIKALSHWAPRDPVANGRSSHKEVPNHMVDGPALQALAQIWTWIWAQSWV